MLKFWSSVALGVSLLLAGCSENKGQLEARWHFVGADGLRGPGSTAGIKALLAGTNAAPFGNLLSARLSQLFAQWASGTSNIAPATVESIRPAVDDLMAHESVGEVWKMGESDRVFLMAVRVTKDRAPIWVKAWSDLWAAAYAGKEGHGKPSVSADQGWLIVASDLKGGQYSDFKKRVLGEPNSASTLLTLEGAIPDVPAFQLEATVKDGRVRTSATFKAPALAVSELEPWHTPTNLIRNQLISFVAMRGWGPKVLDALGLSELQPKTPVGEIFIWGNQHSLVNNYIAVENGQPAAFNARAANFFLPMFNPPTNSGVTPWVGELYYEKTNHVVALNNTPFPRSVHLFPAMSESNAFSVLAFMPPPRLKEPFDTNLLHQLDTPGLIYYDWEITAEIADHWNLTLLNFDLIRAQLPPNAKGPGQRWLWGGGITNLGNTITRVVQKSPGEFDLLRNSDSGLSAFELVELTRWLDGPTPHIKKVKNSPAPPGAPR